MELIAAKKSHWKQIVNLSRKLRLPQLKRLEGFDWDNPKFVRLNIGSYAVVIDKNIVVAVVGLDFGKRQAQIDVLVVKTGYRDKGIGRLLVDYACSRAKLSGKKKVIVESFCVYRARKFYESCGFQLQAVKKLDGHAYYSMRKKV